MRRRQKAWGNQEIQQEEEFKSDIFFDQFVSVAVCVPAVARAREEDDVRGCGGDGDGDDDDHGDDDGRVLAAHMRARRTRELQRIFPVRLGGDTRARAHAHTHTRRCGLVIPRGRGA